MNNTEAAPQEPPLSEGLLGIVRILRVLFTGLRVLIVLLIISYLFSGIFIVDANQHALLLRFGRIKKVLKKNDWYFAWPKPIDQVEKINAKEITTLDSNHFWYKEQAKSALQDPKQPQTPQEGPLKVGDDGYFLTADYNILHTKWSLQYHISDAKVFYTSYAKPEEAIRFALENAVLKKAAATTIDTAFRDQKDKFQNEVAKELKRIVARMNIGVHIDQVHYLQKQVPRPTKKAFFDVTNAENKKDQILSEADAYRKELLKKAEGECITIIRSAETYRKQVVDSVTADAKYLGQIEAQYEKSGSSILIEYYVDALEEVIKNAEHLTVVYPDQEIRLTIKPLIKKKKPAETGKESPRK